MDRALATLCEKRDIPQRSAASSSKRETLDEKDLAELIGPPAGPPIQVAAE